MTTSKKTFYNKTSKVFIFDIAMMVRGRKSGCKMWSVLFVGGAKTIGAENGFLSP